MFLRQRPDLELKPLAILFAAFIFLCGLTHLVQMVTLWSPIYETQAFVKAATAFVSVATAIMIFPLIPKAVAIPSPRSLQLANDGLRREIEAHERTLVRLHEARTELEKRVAERTRELERAKRRFEALITASAQVFWTTSAEGRVEEDSPTWRAFTGQTYDQWRGSGWLDAVHPDDRTRTIMAWREAVASRNMYRVDYRLKSVDGDYRWTAARGVPLLDENGAVSEWVGMNEDITSRKQAEEHSNLIMRELSHRTKNLLAVIASLVRRTFDGKRDPQMQAADFVERIHGLARSHDLLVRGDWRGVLLGELVLSHLEPFGIDPERLSVGGPPVELRPEAAQNVGLALHELATNATKHGAFKRSGTGSLKVTWRIEPNGGEPTLLLEWIEDTVAASSDSRPSGFGRVMLEQLVGASVGGTAQFDLADARLYWQLKAPLQNIVSRKERA